MVMVLGAARTACAQHLSFQTFDEESGLSNFIVTALAQDQDGFLYVGTQAGLFRFDGLHFGRLGPDTGLPAATEVEALAAKADGGLWVVYADRIYLIGNGASISAPLPTPLNDDHAHRAVAFGRDLLLIRNAALLRVRVTSNKTLLVQPVNTASAAPVNGAQDAVPAGGFESVHVEHGTIWLGCGEMVCRLDKAGLVALGSAVGLPADHWTALLRDHSGTLWLRSPTRIASMPQTATRFSIFDVPGGAGRFLTDAGELDLSEDEAGDVVTQSADGLLVHQNGRWTTFNEAGSLAHLAVSAMLLDRSGSFWVGTRGRGIARTVGLGLLENWDRADGLSDDMVWSITRDGGGTFWTSNDLAVDPLAAPAGVKPYPLRAYALATSPGGALWIGAATGSLMRRDWATGQTRVMPLLGPIYRLAAEPNGPLWIGMRGGLARINRPDEAAATAMFDLQPFAGRVYDITFDAAGEVWVLTDSALFHRDAEHRWRAVQDADPAGSLQTRVFAFAPDGTLWLGSFTTGVTRLHLKHGVVVARDRLPSSHLASLNVEMLLRDRDGRMWVGTDHGLDVTDGVHWRHLDDQDGLSGNDINEAAGFIDRDGTPWFGTTGGLSHVVGTKRLFSRDELYLHPVITGVSFGDLEVPFGVVRSRLIRLRWARDPLVFSFAALDFGLQRSIHFRYRLAGLDRRWVDTTSREARYPDPPSGKLVFEVMAVDPLHRLLSQPVRIVIKLQAPWWRSAAAYTSLAALLLAALTLLWRLRVSFLLARQRQLEALVAERTSEIEQARQILFKQAQFDSLTGLESRQAILDRLEAALEQARRAQTPLAVALLDIDHFKRINDQYGHLGGDAVLHEVGARLSASLRDSDRAGRYGGEELLLVLPGLKREAFERMHALRVALFSRPFLFEEVEIRMSCSMGVTWMQPGDDMTALIRRADAALYAAKRNGRDRVIFDPPSL